MNIGILGSGSVAQTLALPLVAKGHKVWIGSRFPEATRARFAPDSMGNPGPGAFFRDNPAVSLVTLAEAAKHGELLINATNGSGSIESLTLAGSDNLAGKVLVDIANPLDFSKGMPPTLFVCNTESLAERIQAAFPKAKVVKTLNTMTASVMLNPSSVAGGDHSVFLGGNDDGAKAVVRKLLESFGWKDILDLGDITSARGTEMLLPAWLKLWASLGTGSFNFKIAR